MFLNEYKNTALFPNWDPYGRCDHFFCALAIRLPKEKITAFPSVARSWHVFLWDYTRRYEHCKRPSWIVRLPPLLFNFSLQRGSDLLVQWLQCRGCQGAKMPAAGRECRQLSGLWCFWQRCWFSSAVSPGAQFCPHISAMGSVGHKNADAQRVTASCGDALTATLCNWYWQSLLAYWSH